MFFYELTTYNYEWLKSQIPETPSKKLINNSFEQMPVSSYKVVLNLLMQSL